MSSYSMRTGGVSRSSYWPRRAVHKKATRNPAATTTDAINRTTITCIYTNASRRATHRAPIVANNTTEIEETGIRIAETKGDR